MDFGKLLRIWKIPKISKIKRHAKSLVLQATSLAATSSGKHSSWSHTTAQHFLFVPPVCRSCPHAAHVRLIPWPKFAHNWPDSDQHWPSLSKLAGDPAEFPPLGPNFGHARPMLGKVWLRLVEIGQRLAQGGPNETNFGQNRARVGSWLQSGYEFAQLWVNIHHNFGRIVTVKLGA